MAEDLDGADLVWDKGLCLLTQLKRYMATKSDERKCTTKMKRSRAGKGRKMNYFQTKSASDT